VFTVVGVVVAVLAGSLVFLVTRSHDVALALSLSRGQELHYRVQLNEDGTIGVQGQTQPIHLKTVADETWRVVSVESKGFATSEVSSANGKLTANGNSVSGPKTSPLRVRVAPDGRMVTGGDLSSAAAGASGGIPGSTQFTPLLPDHPVSPGDTWAKAFDQYIPFSGATVHISSQNTFLRYETIAGAKTAVIRSVLTYPLDLQIELKKLLAITGSTLQDAGFPAGSDPKIGYSGTIKEDGTYWLLPDHGQMVKASTAAHPTLTMRFIDFPADQVPPGSTARFTGSITIRIDPK